MAYNIEIISIERKKELAEQYDAQVLYEIKSEIYGCCIKLLAGSRLVKESWEESFYSASQSIRSHGRIYALEDKAIQQNQVYYDPLSRSCFIFNMDYYGWIKSLALSMAGDILEDNHSIYSVHGACLDLRGRGVCILGGREQARPLTPMAFCDSPRRASYPMTGSSPGYSGRIYWPLDRRKTSTSGPIWPISGRSILRWWKGPHSTIRGGRW